MERLRFFYRLTTYAWKSVCQQILLLAALSVLFFALPMGAGPVAEDLLSEGVGFSGLTLAVTAPEGDGTPALLEELTGSMRDIRAYCAFRAMDKTAALEALEDGDVTAILQLPENFIQQVLDGGNPDLTLIVPEDRPLESLLTFWVGQSAADLLTSAQLGIYTVLELYPGEAACGRSWDQVKMEINLEYINLALNRQELFRRETLSATDLMDVPTHYGLSLLVFLSMSLPPLLTPLYQGESMAFRRRLRSLGYGAAFQFGSSLTAAFGLMLLLTALPGLYLTRGNWAGVAILVLFSALFGSLCCLLSSASALCGGLSFLLAGLNLFLTGGVLPPALLPSGLRAVGQWLPGGMQRQILFLPPEGWGDAGISLLGIGLWSMGLLIAGILLMRRRLREEGL